jgi:hypothetical protein
MRLMTKPQTGLFLVLAWLVVSWTPPSAAQEEHAFRNVREGNLGYIVRASSGLLTVTADEKSREEIKQSFDLTVWNYGDKELSFSGGWEIKVYPSGSDRSTPVCVDSQQVNEPWKVAPGAGKTVFLECRLNSSSKLGNYEVDAGFLPTGRVVTIVFTISSRPADSTLLFTGKLMGYFRFPNHEPTVKGMEWDRPHCTDPTNAFLAGKDTEIPEQALSADAQIFINAYGEKHHGVAFEKVLVGTGDNFAPNYYSRVFSGTWPPGKELYDWDVFAHTWISATASNNNLAPDATDLLQQGKGVIPTDNVACFLAYAHYDAVVPGKHDFYYGPDRLRELGRFMASIPKDEFFQPTQMLAANLMIKTTWAKDHAPISDGHKPTLNFLTKYLPAPPPAKAVQPVFHNLQISDFTDGGFAFPWMRFVRISATGWKEDDLRKLGVYLCRAPRDNPDGFRTDLKKICDDGVQLQPDLGAMIEANIDASFQVPTDSHSPVQLVYPLEHELEPGQNYAVCAANPDVTLDSRTDIPAPVAQPYCFRFSVYQPFFQYYDRQGGSGGSLPPGYHNPQHYVLKETNGHQPVVIFGVVDPSLLDHIGGSNYLWKNIKNSARERNTTYKTQIAIAEPVGALIHLQDRFEEEYRRDHDGKEFHGLRVLLAQMPPDEARSLSEHLPKCVRFDVVVSAADDGLATPNQFLRVHPAEWEGNQKRSCRANVGASGLKETAREFLNGAIVTRPTFIAVPPTHQQSVPESPGRSPARAVQVRSLRITRQSDAFETYELIGDPLRVPLKEVSSPEFVNAENSFWLGVCQAIYDTDPTQPCKAQTVGVNILGISLTISSRGQMQPSVVHWDKDVKNAALQQLALWCIRKQHHADVALLQQRDFYVPGFREYLQEDFDPTKSIPDLQQILDRILWKDDFIHVIAVQGATLKNILKQSDQFSKADKAAYLPVSEIGRSLITLGIKKDPQNDGEYLVNDKPMDPGSLYTVATSDYIALGDTGYADLATPPVGDPGNPTNANEMLVRISSRTCEILRPFVLGNQTHSDNSDRKCGPSIKPTNYYDELIAQTPSDSRSGNTIWHQFVTWTPFHTRFGQPTVKNTGAPPGPDDIANQIQKRVDALTNWEWAFTQLSVGFSGLSHNYSESTLSQHFAGVLNSQVNAKHAHSWDWDADSKFTLYHPQWDLFAQETMQYSSTFTAQLQPPRSESQARNLFALDWGTYLHLLRSRGKGLPQLSWVLSGHFETPAADPIVNVNLKAIPPSTSSTTLTFDQGRTKLLLGRAGMRWQNRKSYIEGGLEGGQTLNAIRQYNVLPAPGATVLPCPLKAEESLTTCINNYNIPGNGQPSPANPITSASQVTLTRSPQDRYGAYWNIGLIVPVYPTISYSFQDTSDYFFLSNGDNSADTRFRHQLINTVKFNVFPNFSFEPTYTVFLYENKLDYHFLFQQQLAVKINYSPDWSNWHEFWQQMRYKKPAGP